MSGVGGLIEASDDDDDDDDDDDWFVMSLYIHIDLCTSSDLPIVTSSQRTRIKVRKVIKWFHVHKSSNYLGAYINSERRRSSQNKSNTSNPVNPCSSEAARRRRMSLQCNPSRDEWTEAPNHRSMDNITSLFSKENVRVIKPFIRLALFAESLLRCCENSRLPMIVLLFLT